MESSDPAADTIRRREIPATLESAGLARDFVAGVLAEPDVEPPIDRSQLADIQLVVSELVTNAVTHGSGPPVLAVALTARHVRVSVTSTRNNDPPIQVSSGVPAPSARSGRGLAIVHALADSLEATVAESTWTVDCEFERR